MNNPTSLVLRWYRQSTGLAQPQQHPYTPQEVLQLLRPVDIQDNDRGQPPTDDRAVRSDAVRHAASRPAAWLGELTNRQRQEIGALADRLPSLVFHHSIGGDTGELVRRYGGWSTWRYERALELAGSCIANHLNSTQPL
jgi:hypothetical protein